MSHVILIALTLDEVGTADDTDLIDGVLARLDEFYPTADPAVPSYRTATVVSRAVAEFIADGIEIHTEARDDHADRVARDAEQALDALDLKAHGA